ncbi:hypothetical protein GYA28_02615 [Candidatus Roizmanbacteria bacterium]|jgi:hypothetical protein|nr:hypothetical protein [Candidatus Roizmanbacteria bacterium]
MNVVHAEVVINESTFGPAKIANFATILNVILPLLMTGAAVIFLAMLLLGAYQWITAGDSAENMKKAQAVFTSAIIGLVIVLVSFVLVRVIGYIIGVQILQ